MPGAATSAAGGGDDRGETGGGGGGEIASTGTAGVACLTAVVLPLTAAAAAVTSVEAAAVSTNGVGVEGGVGGACDGPEAEQSRGGLAAAGHDVVSEVELSAAGLEKKSGPVSSRTAAVGARVEAPVAATAVAAKGAKAALTGPTAATQRPAAAGGAGLSIEASAAAAATEAAAPAAATADAPGAPGSGGGATVASALSAGPRERRRPSISSDGRPPTAEAAASPSSARSSGNVTPTIANPVVPGSPRLRAVRPPRRDIRKAYLTNLGMKGAVVAGPGGTRTPPPMVRRSSFIEVSRSRRGGGAAFAELSLCCPVGVHT